MKWFIISLFCFLNLVRADDHWGTTPPVPEINIKHNIFSGEIIVDWISDSSFDKPIWYIVEIKQVDESNKADPQFFWFRPFVPIQSNFNEAITIRMSYRDAFGQVNDWVRAEMFRIRSMWGA
jgi:hypothetical protein